VKAYAPANPHKDRLLFVRELSQIVGLNEKAIREAMRSGLKHYTIGTGKKPIQKITLRWWGEWLEREEASAVVSRRAQEIIASASRPRIPNLSQRPDKIKAGVN